MSDNVTSITEKREFLLPWKNYQTLIPQTVSAELNIQGKKVSFVPDFFEKIPFQIQIVKIRILSL